MTRNCWRVSCQQPFTPNVDKIKSYSCFYCPSCKILMNERAARRGIERAKSESKHQRGRITAQAERVKKHREKLKQRNT